MPDQEIELIRRHAETMACIVVEIYKRGCRIPNRNRASQTQLARAREWIYAANNGRRGDLRSRQHEGADREPEPADAIARLRGVLPPPGIRSPRTVPRGRRKRQVHGSQPASEPAHVLPAEQGPRAFRGRVQPDALRARQVRPLRASLPAAVARHLAALGDGTDRRHLHRKINGRRPRGVRAVRQRLSLGPDARRHKGCAGAWTVDVPGAHRLFERAARDGQEPDARPGARADRAPRFRRVRDWPLHQAATAQAGTSQGLDQPARLSAHITGDRRAAAEPTLCRHRRRPGVPRSRKTRRLRAPDLRGPVLPRARGLVRPTAEHHATAAGASGLPATRLRALRVLWSRPHRQLVQGPQRGLRATTTAALAATPST